MKNRRQRVLFVTGTDTGVGKTVLTLRLLRELRGRGEKAIALKPFCSGDREDARRIVAEMGGEKRIAEINPYYSKQPVAPAIREFINPARPGPNLGEILSKIRKSAENYDWIIVEGVGGLLVPLTKELFVVDVIQALKCPVVVVARDQLGTLNHSLLTILELQRRRIRVNALVLMENCEKDSSRRTNKIVISQLIRNVYITTIEKLSNWPKLESKTDKDETILKITLANIWDPRIVWPR